MRTTTSSARSSKAFARSDPDAAVYWLARMIDAGEDPLFIARRLVILASEDVGLADSRGISVAIAAQQAVHFVGMPEGFYPLAHATLYLARAPKSNSVGRAYSAALRDVEETRNEPVPLHLRNAPTGLMKEARIWPRLPLRATTTTPMRRKVISRKTCANRRYYDPGQPDARESASTIERTARKKKSGPCRGPPFPLLLLGVCNGASHNHTVGNVSENAL